ncbi:hypothetical protein RIF29_29276 [Crotalaria pallida]|uniref:Fe2OG dioxygenase domain-containing protein n=1 Tax=Crotalaria pallida TaxID=3830 RepID=A0AAN9EEG0_CROPI
MSLKGDNEPVFVVKEATSIAVPSVQELVKKDPLQVPAKYVRSHEEMEKDKLMPHLSSEVPIIDFALLSDGNVEELSKMDIACKEWGFFQLVNHGVKKEVRQRLKDATTEFFNLPIEEKEKSAMASDDIFGYGHDPIYSEDQMFEWSDSLVLLVHPSRYSNPSYWPKTPKGFKEIVEAYSSEVHRVGVELLNFFSMIMGMQKQVLFGLHKESMAIIRANYYPPCNMPEQVMGLNPHSDTCTITLLMQDDDVSGLEIKHKGNWVPVNPIPDALVINVADMLEIWSNGKYKSIEHRAIINKNKGRTSYALFISPMYDVEVEPVDSMMDELNPKLYKKIRYGDLLKEAFKKKFDGKPHIDMLKV